MTNPATLILLTTRIGSRSAVTRLNQSWHVHKGEPKRRRARAGTCSRIVEPGARNGTPSVPVESKASPLLVILHYLLKNNIRIYEDVMCRNDCPPSPFWRLGTTSRGGGQTW